MQLINAIVIIVTMSFTITTFAAEEKGSIPPVYCNAGFSNDPLNPNAAGGIDVLFLNGISNKPEDALLSTGKLLEQVVAPMRSQYPGGIRVSNIYNPTGGFFTDLAELKDQAQAEAKALERTTEKLEWLKSRHPNLASSTLTRLDKGLYIAYLREAYIESLLEKKNWELPDQDGTVKDATGDGSGSEFIGPVILKVVAAIEERLLAGRRVVIVAHSQGNHFIEAAYALLRVRLTPEQLAGLQIVGVAVVAHTTPNNRWVTIRQDKTVFWADRGLTWSNLPLGSPYGNFDAIANKNKGFDLATFVLNGTRWPVTSDPSFQNVYTWNPNGHSFNDIYLSNQIFNKFNPSQTLLGEVQKLVKEAIDNTVAPRSVASLGTVSATMSWINNTDIDLHINELFNDGSTNTHVSFNRKTGRLGYLDVDDRDGQGPEHYYTNTFANIDLNSNQCIALQGKTLEFSVNPYDSLPATGEPVVLNVKIGNTIYSKSLIINDSDQDTNSGRGKLLFKVEFGLDRQYKITTY